MANTDYAYNVYGLRRIKLQKGATVIELPVAQTIDITPQFDSAELRGDDIVWAKIAKLNSVKLSLKNGGLPLEALAFFLGTSPVITNTGLSNEVRTLTFAGGEVVTPVYLFGEVRGSVGDNVHLKFFNVIIDTAKLNFGDANFATNATEFTAIKDTTTGKLMEVLANKTAVALP